MEEKFNEIICNGVIYKREDILKAIETWMSQNVILNYGVIRVVNETVKPDLFELFNIKPHYPLEYREKHMNGTNFLTNIILDCGISVGREEKSIELNRIMKKREEEYLKLLEEKQNYIKELETKLAKQELVSIKK